MAIDRTPLSLVKGEIDQTLYRAQSSLESYAENPNSPYFLQTCAEYLHEVTGILGFVEVQGGVLLAKEIEQVVTALSNGKIESSAAEVAMRALLQLPDYLERIQGGSRDLPIALLPLINELREAQGAALLTEDLVFFPDFAALPALNTANIKSPSENTKIIKQARSLFQSGLVSWFRNRDDQTALQRLSQAIQQLRSIAIHPEVSALWWVGAGLIEIFQAQELELPAARALFGKIDRPILLNKLERNIKRLLDGGEAVVVGTSLLPLISQILYHVACSATRGPIVSELRTAFHLEDALPNEDNLAAIRNSMRGANRAVMTTVSAALREDLSGVMDAIDMFVRRRDPNLEVLTPVVERIRQISATLTVIDQESAQIELDYVADTLTQMVKSAPAEPEIEETLITLATRLVKVESILSGLGDNKSPSASEGNSLSFNMDDRNLQRAVFQQALASIAQAKDALTVFVRESALKEWEAAQRALSEVSGGLIVLNLDCPRRLLETCLQILGALSPASDPLATEKAKDLLDRLVLAIAALEFYLEEQSHDRKGEAFLAQGEAALMNLPSWEAPAPEPEISLFGESAESEPEEEEFTLTPPTEALEEMFQDLGLTNKDQWEHEAEQQIETMLNPAPVEPAPASPTPLPPLQDIDSEMAEVFAEEVREEMASIDLNVPNLRAAIATGWREHEASLRTLRRSFHTLKGSGRMVGAARLGELAWAVENLLNRLLDNTVPLSPAIVHVVEESRGLIPGLLTDFQTGGNTVRGIEEIAEQAWRLAHAGPPALVLPPEPTEPEAPAPVTAFEEEITLTSSAPLSFDEEINFFNAEEITLSSPETTPAPAPEESPANALDWDFSTVDSLDIPAPTPSVVPPATPASTPDPMLVELFTIETQEYLDTMTQALTACREMAQCAIGDDLLRPLHTILGSARMAQIDGIATLSYALEQNLRARAAAQIALEEQICTIIEWYIALIRDWLTALSGMSDPPDNQPWLDALTECQVTESPTGAESTTNRMVDLFLEEALDTLKNIEDRLLEWLQDPAASTPIYSLATLFENLGSGAEIAEIAAISKICSTSNAFLQRAGSEPALQTAAAPKLLSSVIERLWVMLEAVRDYQPIPPAEDLITEFDNLLKPPPKESDLSELTLMFLGVAEDLMVSLESQIRAATEDPNKIAEIQLTLHNLNSGAGMIGAQTLADLTRALESMIIQVVDGKLPATQVLFDLLQMAFDQITAMLDQVLQGLPLTPAPEIHTRIERFLAQPTPVAPPAAPSPRPVAPSVAPAVAEKKEPPPASIPELNELTVMFLGEAEDLMINLEQEIQAAKEEPSKIGEMRRTLHTIKGGARMIGIQTLADLTHALESMIIQVVEGKLPSSQNLFELLQSAADQIAAMLDQIRNTQPVPAALDLQRRIEQLAEIKSVPSPRPVAPSAAPAGAEKKEPPPASIPELNELTVMFLGEAEDLMANLEQEIQSAKEEPSKIGEMRRTLHTIKGGARMIGIQTLADLTHALESMIIQVVEGKLPSSQNLFELLQSAVDQIAAMLDQIRNTQPVPPALDLQRRIEQLAGIKAAAPSPLPVAPATPIPVPVEEKKEAPEGATAPAQPQERIWISADLLNKFVNHAAEVSITRSRVDQQISGFSHSLQEMEQTVKRLHEQWRKFETEIDSKKTIIHPHESVGDTGFDPLELDRYSNLNQLSRSLMESLSDLASLHGLLSGSTRDTEFLLLQQARVTKELQEGLMRTRMVPFSGQIQRLQRIVRQTAQAVNIKAELKLIGAELELDRTVLDRMVAPLEHILRNSISHGIEPPADRRAAGKNETGIITITLKREAQEIVLLASDDGRGLNLPAIRRKAIERGRLTPDAEISDKEVMQLILEPGVSTAKEVTQISGRGVGMDVVHNEVKLLGGTLEIDSEFGHGTTFTIRLPVTLAVSKVLLINVQGDIFAIPLIAIRAVLQLSYEELINLQNSKRQILTRGGIDYQFIHAAVLLNSPTPSYNLIPGEKLPVLLFSVGEMYIAIAVDRLLGAREIVVKSVGPQLGRIREISGATILGDGRVVIILDIAALIRKSVALHSKLFMEGAGLMKKVSRKAGLTVLVVDDSITVRKITARLLERHQMTVFTARDGVDAVELMQKHLPDIVLMDIEMPRMDGYELASYIRTEPRFREIPIVMITSRTGVKHRERARSIGVSHYLGKPYQEAELLDMIHQLTRRINIAPQTLHSTMTIN